MVRPAAASSTKLAVSEHDAASVARSTRCFWKNRPVAPDIAGSNQDRHGRLGGDRILRIVSTHFPRRHDVGSRTFWNEANGGSSQLLNSNDVICSSMIRNHQSGEGSGPAFGGSSSSGLSMSKILATTPSRGRRSLPRTSPPPLSHTRASSS
jgi:hypothetical protein